MTGLRIIMRQHQRNWCWIRPCSRRHRRVSIEWRMGQTGRFRGWWLLWWRLLPRQTLSVQLVRTPTTQVFFIKTIECFSLKLLFIRWPWPLSIFTTERPFPFNFLGWINNGFGHDWLEIWWWGFHTNMVLIFYFTVQVMSKVSNHNYEVHQQLCQTTIF